MTTQRGKAPTYHFTQQQARDFARRYAAGESAKSISKEVGCGAQTILRLLKREGVHTPRRPGPRSRYSEAEIRTMIERYSAGESLKVIAEDFGCTAGNVRFLLRNRNVATRVPGRPPISDETLEWIRAQRAQGVTFKAIARELGVSDTHVAATCRRMGLAPDPKKRGAESPAWRGGVFTHGTSGYRYEFVSPDDPLYAMASAMGYVPQHRLVMARAVGRTLQRSESVHHINGDKTDNRLDNLQLRQGNHGKGSAMQCLDCGSHNVGHVEIAD